MKIAIIGASGHGLYAIWGMNKRPKSGARLVGLAHGSQGESIEGFAKQCREHGHEPPIFEDWRRMLDDTRPDIAVIHPHFHDNQRIALAALDRKIHVYVDKPVAFTQDGIDELRLAHKGAGTQFCAMLNMRYEPEIRAVWKAAAGGALGEVRLIHAHKSYRLGQRAEFFKHRDTFGGLIPWVGSHAIDMIGLAGGTIASIEAGHSTRGNRGHGELEVSAALLFRLENEAFATAGLEYLRPAAAPTHEDDRLRVAGTDGVAEARDKKAWIIDAGGMRELPLEQDLSFFGDFMDQVAGTGRCDVTAEDSFRNSELCLAALRAADTGKTVDLRGQSA